MSPSQRAPLVSVITIVRNGLPHVERAVTSVLAQTYPAVEYIVKDGASTDGTLDLLDRYRERISRIESRPDRGISDAWNQALELVTGRYVALLNADDEYEPTLLDRAVTALETTGADLAFCDVDLGGDSERAERRVHAYWNPARLWQGTGFLHPGVVARRDAYLRVGKFREDLRYAMDAEWILRLHGRGGRFVKHEGVCRMSTGGVSNRQWMNARREYLRVLRDHRIAVWQRALGWAWFTALRIRKARGARATGG